MKFNLRNMLFNSTFGDTHMAVGKKVIAPTFISTSTDLLWLKRKLITDCGMVVTRVGEQVSGYGGKKKIMNMRARGTTELKELFDSTSREQLLSEASDTDLLLWYLDDGSWHIRSELMHLYCNELNELEVQALIKRMEELYGVAPTLRFDRKKDGRSFPYLYFNRELVNVLRDKWFAVVEGLELKDLYYKFGGQGYKNYAGNKAKASDVPAIRQAFADGVSLQELSHTYALRYVTLDNIVKNKTFKDI